MFIGLKIVSILVKRTDKIYLLIKILATPNSYFFLLYFHMLQENRMLEKKFPT